VRSRATDDKKGDEGGIFISSQEIWEFLINFIYKNYSGGHKVVKNK